MVKPPGATLCDMNLTPDTTSTPARPTDVAVQASGLVKVFGDNRAVDSIDLDVRRGEIYGVLGPNGAGKTTTLMMLATLLRMDGGEASIFGVDVRREPHIIRQLIGVTGQYASVDENLTARENLWLFGRLMGLAPPSRNVGPWTCSSSSAWRRRPTVRSPPSPGACDGASTWPPA